MCGSRRSRLVRSLPPVLVLAIAALFSVVSPASAATFAPGDILYRTSSDPFIHLARANGSLAGSLGVYGTKAKWSPDGTRFAFYDPDDSGYEPSIHIYTAGTGSVVRLSEMDLSNGWFCWDAGSANILHEYDMAAGATVPEWWVKAPAVQDGEDHAVDTLGENEFVREVCPIPDGTYAVIEVPYVIRERSDWTYYRSYSPRRLKVMDASGFTYKTAPTTTSRLVDPCCPDVSPDGNKVVFSATSSTGATGVYVWTVSTNTIKRFFAGTDDTSLYPSFTGDGLSIIWTRTQRNGAWGPEIWIADSSGANARRLITNGAEADPRPASPLPRATVSTPSGPSTARHGRLFTVAGYVSPRHVSGDNVALLYCYRYQSKHWVLRKMVRAKRYNYSTAKSKFSARLSLPYTGKWLIRAYHADAGHRASWSVGHRHVTVR